MIDHTIHFPTQEKFSITTDDLWDVVELSKEIGRQQLHFDIVDTTYVGNYKNIEIARAKMALSDAIYALDAKMTEFGADGF